MNDARYWPKAASEIAEIKRYERPLCTRKRTFS